MATRPVRWCQAATSATIHKGRPAGEQPERRATPTYPTASPISFLLWLYAFVVNARAKQSSTISARWYSIRNGIRDMDPCNWNMRFFHPISPGTVRSFRIF